MGKKVINPSSLVEPIGYNHGILVDGGRLLFLSGQDSSDAEGKIVGPGDIYAQFEQILRNLKAIVEAAGGQMNDIVKLNIFVRNRGDYQQNLKRFGPLFRSYFQDNYYPAMAFFEVRYFFKAEALIELEGYAVIDHD